jgi:hypothetical protein
LLYTYASFHARTRTHTHALDPTLAMRDMQDLCLYKRIGRCIYTSHDGERATQKKIRNARTNTGRLAQNHARAHTDANAYKTHTHVFRTRTVYAHAHAHTKYT